MGGEHDRAQLETTMHALMVRAQAADKVAYRELLSSVSRMVRPYVLTRIGDADAADDLIQEVLLAVHNARHTYDAARPFLPWLWAVMRYRIVDFIRRKSRGAQALEVSGLPMEDFIARDNWDDLDTKEFLRIALAKLPVAQKRAIELTKLDGLSMKEAAGELGMTEAAVRVTVHRGKKTLRKVLEDMGYEA